MRELVGEHEIHEAVVLSTCNRTELYLVVGDAVEAETAVLGRLARRAGMRPTELRRGHLLAAQLRRGAAPLPRHAPGWSRWSSARPRSRARSSAPTRPRSSAQSTGPLTNKLFRAALATGKRVRTDTAISAGRASVASVAVDAAREALGDLGSRHVLIIGAGETAEGTARALHEQGVRDDVRRQPPARARDRAGAALRRRDDRVRRAARRARAGRHRRRLHLLAAPDPRRRGARAGDARSAPAGRCC